MLAFQNILYKCDKIKWAKTEKPNYSLCYKVSPLFKAGLQPEITTHNRRTLENKTQAQFMLKDVAKLLLLVSVLQSVWTQYVDMSPGEAVKIRKTQ